MVEEMLALVVRPESSLAPPSCHIISVLFLLLTVQYKHCISRQRCLSNRKWINYYRHGNHTSTTSTTTAFTEGCVGLGVLQVLYVQIYPGAMHHG